MIGIILARGGSKRIHKKNIKLMCDRPLIYWTLDHAVKALTKLYVRTDCEEIRRVVSDYPAHNVSVIMTQTVPDAQTSEEGVLQVLKTIHPVNEFVMLQATSPLIDYSDINRAIAMYNDNMYDSVVSGTIHDTRCWSDMALYLERDKVRRYILNGAIWVSSAEVLSKYNYLAGGKCGFMEMEKSTFIDIDTEDDFNIAETLLMHRIISNE